MNSRILKQSASFVLALNASSTQPEATPPVCSSLYFYYGALDRWSSNGLEIRSQIDLP